MKCNKIENNKLKKLEKVGNIEKQERRKNTSTREKIFEKGGNK